MHEDHYVTVSAAVALTHIPKRTLHYWIMSNKLPAMLGKGQQRGKLVKLADVQRLAELTGRAKGLGQASAEEQELALTPSDTALAVIENQQRLMSKSSGNALIAHLESLYRDQIASKDDLIAELRRRAEVPEQEAGEFRRQLAALPGPGVQRG